MHTIKQQQTTLVNNNLLSLKFNLILTINKAPMFCQYTDDTRYLDILGSLQKMSRYPYVKINVDNSMLTNSVRV